MNEVVDLAEHVHVGRRKSCGLHLPVSGLTPSSRQRGNPSADTKNVITAAARPHYLPSSSRR